MTEGTQARPVGEGEAGSPLRREPEVGFHPRNLGSRPELKAEAQRLSHPGAPIYRIFIWRENTEVWKARKFSDTKAQHH